MNKYFVHFALILLSLTSFSCWTSKSQEVQNPEEFVLSFYKTYHSIWASEDLFNKRQSLDSVLQMYLTQELFSKVKEPNLDHDLVIKDHYTTPEYLHTLAVAKIENSENCFVVSYKAPGETPSGDIQLVDIKISICLIKIDDAFKVSSIE